MNWELSDVQAAFRKGRGTTDQIANISWITEKAREFQKKKIYFCFINYTTAFDCVDNNKLWKILKEMGITEHLTWLLRNLYTGQGATVRTRHRTMEWFQIRKGICQSCVLSSYLFNLYAYLTYMLNIIYIFNLHAYLTLALCEMPDWMKQSWNQDCHEKYQ